MVLRFVLGWLDTPEPASRQDRGGGPPLKFHGARDNLREYGGEKWPRAEQNLLRLLEVEQPAVLARIVAQLRSFDIGVTTTQTDTCHAVMGGSMVRATPVMTSAAYYALITTSVISFCSDRTTTIVELGSGWGANLFALWLAGAPRGAEYIAAEFTAAGRRVSTTIAELEDELRLRSVPFDYHRPELTLSEVSVSDEVVVFTAHSVEQIPHLSRDVIDTILGLGPKVTCLHFEPVGWQLAGRPTVGSSHEYAEANDYNRDLVAPLRDAESSNKIAILSTEVDVIGSNHANATSLITWQTAPAARPPLREGHREITSRA